MASQRMKKLAKVNIFTSCAATVGYGFSIAGAKATTALHKRRERSQRSRTGDPVEQLAEAARGLPNAIATPIMLVGRCLVRLRVVAARPCADSDEGRGDADRNRSDDRRGALAMASGRP